MADVGPAAERAFHAAARSARDAVEFLGGAARGSARVLSAQPLAEGWSFHVSGPGRVTYAVEVAGHGRIVGFRRAVPPAAGASSP